MERIIKVGDFTFTYTNRYSANLEKNKHILITPDGVHCAGTNCSYHGCPLAESNNLDCYTLAKQLLAKHTKIITTKPYYE